MQPIESLTYIQPYVQQLKTDGVLVLDIDETVLHSGEGPGSEPWYDERIRGSIAKGMSEDDAVLEANDAWEKMQSGLPVYLTEPVLLEILADCKKRGVPAMGLTARRPEMASATRVQLTRLGVNFLESAWEAKEIAVSSLVHHVDGVVYGGPLVDKGLAFAQFLEVVGRKPAALVFVDDRIDHIERMIRHCKRLGIAASCFWYKRRGHHRK